MDKVKGIWCSWKGIYLSDIVPEIRDPIIKPMNNMEEAMGVFHWLSQTISHWEREDMTLDEE